MYTVLPLISASGTYLILKLWGAALIGGRCLKEGAPYFKAKGIIEKKFQNAVIFSFLITVNSYYYDI